MLGIIRSSLHQNLNKIFVLSKLGTPAKQKVMSKNIKIAFTGDLVTILCLLKNTTFSTAIHCFPGIIRNVRVIVA